MTGMHTCVPLQAMLLLPASAKLLSRKQSGCWVCTYINTAAHRNCEAASQRKCFRSTQQLQPSCPWFDLHAANAYQSSYLVRFCRIAPAVSLGSCSGSISGFWLLWLGLEAMLLLGPICRIANSSKLQVTLIPFYMHLACELPSPDFTDNGSEPSKAKWARMTVVPMTLDSVYLM